MKLIDLNIAGFGKLVQQRFEFNSGLNLIYGLNEAGKSTLQRAILAMLFGFYEEGNINKVQRQEAAKFVPWLQGSEYGGSLTYELDNGQRFQVRREFEPRPKTSLVDLETGKDVSHQFRSATQGRLYFLEEQIGIDANVFENTCYVRQVELAALDKNAGAITDTLLRLAATASSETTTHQAITALENALKEQIGGAQARIKPLPTALSRSARLETECNTVRENRRLLISRTIEHVQAVSELDREMAEIEKLHLLQLLAEQRLQKKQQEAAEASRQEVERWENEMAALSAWANFPAELNEAIQEVQSLRKRFAADAERQRRRAVETIAKLPDWESELNRLLVQIQNGEPDGTAASLLPLELPNRHMPNGIDQGEASEVDRWIRQWLEAARTSLAEEERQLEVDRARQDRLLKIGRAGLAELKQALRDAARRLEREQTDLDAAQADWNELGLSEDDWSYEQEKLESEFKLLSSWSSFPVQMRDEILRTAARRADLMTNIKQSAQSVREAEAEMNRLDADILTLDEQIQQMGPARRITDGQIAAVQSLSAQRHMQKEIASKAHQTWVEVQTRVQALQEKIQAATPIAALRLEDILALKGSWLADHRMLSEAQGRADEAHQSWAQVGMPVAEFAKLEQTVREIQGGVRPTPKRRKGCREMLWPSAQAANIDNTPTEIKIYADIQPRYAGLQAAHKGLETARQDLLRRETEIRTSLRLPEGVEIQEATFDAAAAIAGELLKVQAELDQQIQQRERLETEAAEAQDILERFSKQIAAELTAAGLDVANLETALNAYDRLVEQKKALKTAEVQRERLVSRKATLQPELRQAAERHNALKQVETEIAAQLTKAGITVSAGLDEALQIFERGCEMYGRWELARDRRNEFVSRTGLRLESLRRSREMVAAAQDVLVKTRNSVAEQLDFKDHQAVDEAAIGHLEGKFETLQQHENAHQQRTHRLEQLENQAREQLTILADWQAVQAETQKQAANLKDLLVKAGISLENEEETGASTHTDGLARGLDAFQTALQKHRGWVKAGEAHGLAHRQYQTMAANLVDIERNQAELARRTAEMITKYPGWKTLDPKETPQIYLSQIQASEAASRKRRDEATRIGQEIKQLQTKFRHPAEVEEDLHMVREEVRRLQFFQGALEMARTELDAAAQAFQREFAPRLETLMEQGLKLTTQQRYASVKIEPTDLTVSVVSPERAELVSADDLSTGTRDLVYLLLRMSIARYMSRSGEMLPLLLDDPLVHFDKVRQGQALEYLARLAERHQILLFTMDESTKGWFEQSYLPGEVYQLISL